MVLLIVGVNILSYSTDALEEPLLATLLPTESRTFAMRFDRMLRSFQLPTTFMGYGLVCIFECRCMQ